MNSFALVNHLLDSALVPAVVDQSLLRVEGLEGDARPQPLDPLLDGHRLRRHGEPLRPARQRSGPGLKMRNPDA